MSNLNSGAVGIKYLLPAKSTSSLSLLRKTKKTQFYFPLIWMLFTRPLPLLAFTQLAIKAHFHETTMIFINHKFRTRV
ncbi:MAG: hypothetical protein DWQ02_18545 [Bacteroidetes bacterium]|nr:MAG: hypothetical protein DWQ02_18545 [Bacteroidota bacterium]